MPLYEYHCDACGREFELIRKFSDPPLEKCPHCDSGPVRKLMSSPAFQFKGTGWYITDYAKKEAGSPSGDGKPEAGAKDAGEKTGEKSGEKTDKTGGTEKSDKAEQAEKKASKDDAKGSTKKSETKPVP
jgi:putative FmdB family regulatory protein